MLNISNNQVTLISHQPNTITIEDSALYISSYLAATGNTCRYYEICEDGTNHPLFNEIKKLKSYNPSKGILIDLIDLAKYAKNHKLKIDGTTFDYLLAFEKHKPTWTNIYCKHILNVVQYSDKSYSVFAGFQGNGTHKVGQSLIIAGFPGTGKSTFTKEKFSKDFIIHDSDSSYFSWVYANGKKLNTRNRLFPINYINHILRLRYISDIVFVSSHKDVRDELNKRLLPFVLFYPSHELKETYIRNYRERDPQNGDKFAEMMIKNYDKFIDEITEEINDSNSLYNRNEYSTYIKLDKSFPYIDKWISANWMRFQMDRYCTFIDSPIFPLFKDKGGK